mgnify:CR=1 FL=1
MHVIGQNHPRIHSDGSFTKCACDCAAQQVNFAQERIRALEAQAYSEEDRRTANVGRV